MKNLCWNLEMVQVIPGKYLLQTRKRIGFPPAPASTNWENQPVISSWSEHKAAFCYSQRLQTLLQTYWILAVWLGTLGRSPGDVFCISLVAKIEEGTVLSDSVFWVPAYLLFQLHGQREHSKKIKHGFLGPQSSCSFSFHELIELEAFHNFFLTISVCFRMVGSEATFLLQLPYLRHLQPLCYKITFLP